jgi:small subunit ribosomal protein S18
MSEETPKEVEAVAEPAPAPVAAAPVSERGPSSDPKSRRRFPRRKICYFRVAKAEYVDYKDVNVLRRFISDSGKILPRRVTGTSAKFQRLVTTAVKRARYMALIPYTSQHR